MKSQTITINGRAHSYESWDNLAWVANTSNPSTGEALAGGLPECIARLCLKIFKNNNKNSIMGVKGNSRKSRDPWKTGQRLSMNSSQHPFQKSSR